MRAWKQTSSGRTYYIYDGDQVVGEFASGNNYLSALNTWGANGLLARHTRAGAWYYTFDMQGNVAQKLNSAGAVLSSSIFDPAGNQATNDPNPDPYSGFGGQWGYVSDYETGLTLLGHRFYDSGTQRFLTRDPCDYDGGINLYAFCQNNPVNLTDAIGLMPSAQSGCKESAAVNAGIKLACARIRGMPPSPGKHSDLCPTAGEKSCLERLCNSNMTIYCGTPDCVGKPTEKGLTDPSICHIIICTGNIGRPAFYNAGISNTIEQIAKTVIHEMLHCCGRGDNGGPPLPGTAGSPSNPADAGARCCMGLGSPYNQGYGR